MMGDHICSGASECMSYISTFLLSSLVSTTELTTRIATPPPDSQGPFPNIQENPPSSVYKQTPTNGAGFLKPGRAMPPRVDTSAASNVDPSHHPRLQLTSIQIVPSFDQQINSLPSALIAIPAAHRQALGDQDHRLEELQYEVTQLLHRETHRQQ